MNLGLKPRNIRQNNQLNIIKLLQKKPYTHKQLATKLNLSNTAIQNILSSLLAKELIVIDKQLINKTGRPSVIVSLNTEKFYTIQVSLNKAEIIVAAYDFSKKLLAQIRGSYVLNDLNDANMNIANLICDMLKNECLQNKTLCNINLSVPGIVNNSNLVITTSLNNNTEPYDPYTFLASLFPYDIIINDKKFNYAQGECNTNKALKNRKVIAFLLMPAPSMSLAINNVVYRGATGFFGEIGFIYENLTQKHQENIRMHNNNNIDSAISLNEVIIDIKKHLFPNKKDKLTIEETAKLFYQKHPYVVEQITNHCNRLCAFVLNLSIFLNFDTLVFSGELAPLKDFYFKEIDKYLKKRAFTPVKLLLGNLSEISTNIGILDTAIENGYKKLLTIKN